MFNVTFKEIGGITKNLREFKTEKEAIEFVKNDVCYQDLESLGCAHIDGQYEPMALYQDNELLGCYHITTA